MGTPDFDFLGDSNPRALGKALGAPCNPRRPAPQSRSNPLSRAKTWSAQMGSPGFAFIIAFRQRFNLPQLLSFSTSIHGTSLDSQASPRR